MSYFNPKIYNKQNLQKSDLREFDYWESVFVNLIESSKADSELSRDTGSGMLDNICNEIIANFCENLKEHLGYALQDNVVAAIDGYNDSVEVKEQENYETYLYVKGDKSNEQHND